MLLVVVLITALLAVTVMGHLHVNAEETQLLRNHVHGVEALALAEAGLNHALAELRAGRSGSVDGSLAGGSYAAVVDGSAVTSIATTSSGFVGKVQARIVKGSDGPPYWIEIDELRINEYE